MSFDPNVGRFGALKRLSFDVQDDFLQRVGLGQLQYLVRLIQRVANQPGLQADLEGLGDDFVEAGKLVLMLFVTLGAAGFLQYVLLDVQAFMIKLVQLSVVGFVSVGNTQHFLLVWPVLRRHIDLLALDWAEVLL